MGIWRRDFGRDSGPPSTTACRAARLRVVGLERRIVSPAVHPSLDSRPPRRRYQRGRSRITIEAMSERVEWDWPPRRSGRYHADLDLDGDGQAVATSRPFRIERRARYVRPGRPLGARLWSGYATVMWQLAKVILAIVVGAFTFAAFAYVRPGRPLGVRLWAAYATGMMFLARVIIAVIVAAFTFAAFGLMVLLLKL
jgi:hypothetical protein